MGWYCLASRQVRENFLCNSAKSSVFTVGMNCCRGQRSGTVYMGQIRLKCPTLQKNPLLYTLLYNLSSLNCGAEN